MPPVREPGEPQLTWKQRLVRHLLGYASLGYLLSLFLHATVLVVMSLIVFRDSAQGLFTIEGSAEDGEEIVEIVEEPLDTTLDEPPPPLVDTSISVETLVTPETAIPELNMDADHTPFSGDSGLGQGLSAGGERPVGVPESAITKGSFTVWTEPEDPKPRQSYFIYIQVKLPENVRRYRQNDLSGMVIGTDGYRLRLPPQPREYLRLIDHNARLKVYVPGAAALVKDIIQVRSRILDEEQTIELVF